MTLALASKKGMNPLILKDFKPEWFPKASTGKYTANLHNHQIIRPIPFLTAQDRE